MTRFRFPTTIWRWLATAVLILLFLPACTSPTPATPEPVAVVETAPPTTVPTATAVPTCEPFAATA
ncbi:MAG: hypothetical protein R3D55_29070, partial [Chloroflexota bacterium]